MLENTAEKIVKKAAVQCRKIDLDDAASGMVLADAVKNTAGGTILAADSILSTKTIVRLKECGIFSIYVEKESAPKEYGILHGKKAIVVEDSLFFRHMFSRNLYNMGFFVCEEAENAEESITFSRRYKPDIIIMDIHLPGMKGSEAIKKITAFLPDVKIFAVSTDQNKSTILEALRAGACDFITKPLNWDMLKPRILNHFEQDPTDSQMLLNHDNFGNNLC